MPKERRRDVTRELPRPPLQAHVSSMRHSTGQAMASRFERAEGMASVGFAAARAARDPQVGATSTTFGSTVAIFDGATSPITQTFGLGLEPDLPGDPDAMLDAVEHWFAARGAPIHHEVCAFAAPAVVSRLPSRGYVPTEASVVSLRAIVEADRLATSGAATVRRIVSDEVDAWADASAAGWRSEGEALADFVRDFGAVMARADGVHCFVAEKDGIVAGTAALRLSDGVALLAGASTIPAARRSGVQGALLAARLAFAASAGADVAMIVTATGSQSQRNAQRAGFNPAYTRVKWSREA